MKLFWISLVGLMVCITGCSDDDETCNDPTNILCPNYDPCTVVELVPIDFTISQGIAWEEERRYFESDTVIYQGDVRLEASEGLERYEWSIGGDPRIFTDRVVELTYNVLGPIEVTFIGQRVSNPQCFPDDIGVDTIKKTFVLIRREDAPIYGKFEGYCESDPNTTFVIENTPFLGMEPSGVSNLPNGCVRNSTNSVDGGSIYNALWMSTLDNFPTCPTPKGWGILAEDRITLTIDYMVYGDNQDTIVDRFIGKKIE